MTEENKYENLIQFVLVDENIRNACFISKCDDSLLKNFRSLKKSRCFGGFLISKQFYKRLNPDDLEFGKILGYPCCEDFKEVYENKIDSFTIRVICHFNDNSYFEIMVNRALNLDKLQEFEEFAIKAEATLKTHLLTKDIVSRVCVEHKKSYCFSTLKHNIKTNTMDEEMCEEFKNFLWNRGYSQKILSYNFDFSKKVDKVVALMLLTICEYDELDQFYPFDDIQEKIHNDIMELQSEEMYKILCEQVI